MVGKNIPTQRHTGTRRFLSSTDVKQFYCITPHDINKTLPGNVSYIPLDGQITFDAYLTQLRLHGNIKKVALRGG
jgi:hypothetical protein